MPSPDQQQPSTKAPGFFGFDQAGVARIVNTVRGFEAFGRFGGGVPSSQFAGLQVIAGHLTSRGTSDTNLYAWTQARYNGTAWAQLPTGSGSNALTGTVTARAAVALPDAGDLSGKYVLLARGARQTDTNSATLDPCWHVVSGASTPPLLLNIGSTTSLGLGFYNVTALSPCTNDINTSISAAGSNVTTTNGSSAGIGLNLLEIGSTNRLIDPNYPVTAGAYFPGALWKTNGDGTKIYVFEGCTFGC